jgi:hypothetical protein
MTRAEMEIMVGTAKEEEEGTTLFKKRNTTKRRRRKSAFEASSLLVFAALYCCANAEGYYSPRRETNVVFRPPMTAVGNVFSSPGRSGTLILPFNPSRVGGSELNFPTASEWNPETDETERVKLTLRFQNDPNSNGGIVMKDATASVLERISTTGSANGAAPPRRKRQRLRSHLDRQSGSCNGRCENMFRCMFQGGRSGRDGGQATACPGMFQVCCTRWSSTGNLNQDVRTSLGNVPRAVLSGTARGPSPLPFSNRILSSDQLSNRRPLPLPAESSRANAGRAISFDSGQNTISYSSGTSTPVFGPQLPPPSRRPSHHSGVIQSPVVTFYDIVSSDYNAYKCGVSRSAQSKIMGGLDAGYGQFPWTAHVKIRGPYGIDKECGGTLVGRRWILTAGHCTQYCKSLPACHGEVLQHEITYKVILGEYHQLFSEEFPTDSYLAVEVIRHPMYKNIMRLNKGVLESEPRYDIAMLYLDRDVRLAPNVAPVCLPQPEYVDLVPGTQGTVVGWGRIGRHEDSPHSNVLQAATVPVLSDWQCFQQTGLLNYDDQVCAGGTAVGSSACPGDSGGALQIQDEDGRWMIVGIVSNGPSICGMQPVVFHRIAQSLNWVARTMENKALSSVP